MLTVVQEITVSIILEIVVKEIKAMVIICHSLARLLIKAFL